MQQCCNKGSSLPRKFKISEEEAGAQLSNKDNKCWHPIDQTVYMKKDAAGRNYTIPIVHETHPGLNKWTKKSANLGAEMPLDGTPSEEYQPAYSFQHCW